MKRSSMILVGLLVVVLALIAYELFGGGASSSDSEPRCGDGKINVAGEQCDDGNQDNDDACNNKCQRTAELCGNGVVEKPLEECDDGNDKNGDGCDQFCKREESEGRCGNGIVEKGEACDDGNRIELDGCDTLCRKSVIAGGVNPELCGNGALDPGEQCDDGNRINGDLCSKDCQDTKMGAWYTVACNECMESKCAEISKECLDNSECVDSLGCFRDSACMSERSGPMACYCGSTKIIDCRLAKSEANGACKDQIEDGIGSTDRETVFAKFIKKDTIGGLTNNTLVCLARRCRKSCTFMFGGTPGVL